MLKKSLFVWIGLIALLVIIIVFSLRGEEAPQNQDSSLPPEKIAAPDFSLELLNGEQVKLSDLEGKVVVLNFSGSW